MKVRHVFQPRQEVEVSDQEAQVLKAQGLLYEGDIDALLASDPIGPLDPPRTASAGTTAPAKAATVSGAAAQKES